MICHFIGIFEGDVLVAIALSQLLDLAKLHSFGDRDSFFKSAVRNFVFRNFTSQVLFIGNNMLTGQNAFALSGSADMQLVIKTLLRATGDLKFMLRQKGMKVPIMSFKDFDETDAQKFNLPEFSGFYRFSTQPNMILKIPKKLKREQDYIDALLKKYRDQYKRARKKAIGIEKRKLSLDEIIAYEDTIYDLYLHVAKNAPFNSFFLAKNHFRVFKECLNDAFLFYGYLLDGKLIGFNTMIKNGKAMETYFLGYDDGIQREKMLYLNMLYDMIAYSINHGYSEIIFARTALEIKSSVGAIPEMMFGFIEHDNKFLNQLVGRLFKYLEPETLWQQRHPFK